MNKKYLGKMYAICEKGSINQVYPQTHFFMFKNICQAYYAFITFASKLNDTNIQLVSVCNLYADIDNQDLIIDKQHHLVTTFDDVLENFNAIDDDLKDVVNMSNKSFLMHYNIVIKSINEFNKEIEAGKEFINPVIENNRS